MRWLIFVLYAAGWLWFVPWFALLILNRWDRLGESWYGPRPFVDEGLTTGDADRDNDGHIALGELYDYVYDRVRERSPHQTPCKPSDPL